MTAIAITYALKAIPLKQEFLYYSLMQIGDITWRI